MRVATTGVLIGILCALSLGVSEHIVCAEGPLSLCQRIPKPDPQKYRSIQDATNWRNPKLVVLPDGVEMVGITPAGQGIPVESVPEKLEHLPDSAWPYGLVVMISDSGIVSSTNDVPRIQVNRSKLLEVLKARCIAVDLWPSA